MILLFLTSILSASFKSLIYPLSACILSSGPAIIVEATLSTSILSPSILAPPKYLFTPENPYTLSPSNAIVIFASLYLLVNRNSCFYIFFMLFFPLPMLEHPTNNVPTAKKVAIFLYIISTSIKDF